MRFQAFLLTLLLILSCGAAHAERRVALVIGNSAYVHAAALHNPKNDALGMSEKLEDLGFEVVRGVDLDLGAMRGTIRDFVGKLEGADMALFFYAGHGLQVGGENYLAPVDARLRSYLDLDFEAVPVNLVLTAMERAAKVNLVFLDACRDNPLAETLARSMGTRSGSVGRGLAKVGSGVGSLVSFATQPGNVALDGAGDNSPFTTALLKHLGTPGQDITRDLVLVRRDVLQQTGGKQVPWDNSSLTGEVILKAAPVVVTPPEPAGPDPRVELTYWETIKGGSSAAYFETYLKRFPDGQFADLARLRLEDLKAAETAAREEKARPAPEPVATGPDPRIELAYWQSVQDAGSVGMFQSYLARYPEGIYAELARLKIDALTRAAEAGAQSAAQSAAQDKVTVASLAPEEGREAEEPAALDRSPTGPSGAAIEPAELARSLQQELNRVGCSVGTVDGDWGARSRRALSTYGREAGIRLSSLDPSAEVLEQIRRSSGRVCPLACGANQEERNGRCVAKPQAAGATSAKVDSKATASAGACPADARNAARPLIKWNYRQLFAVVQHPCGRKITCTIPPNSYNDMNCFWEK